MPPYDENEFEKKPLHSLNLLPAEHRPAPGTDAPGSKRKIYSCFFIVVIVLVTSCTALIARSNNNFFVGVRNGFIVRQLTHIFSGTSNDLKGEKDDRINLLLMGIGGPGHEGPYLTDTIILASFKPSTGEAALLSLPRDLIVPYRSSYIKINSIYALNLKNGIDTAFEQTKKVIGDAFGLPIHYMGVLDFEGFVKLINTIDGVTVTVDKDFTDNQFPVSENKIRGVSFKKGKQKMDGATALTFARSRHGNNGEGSDFARSQRQQKIILATKEKLSSFSTLFNPFKITSLFQLVNEYTKADIEPWEVVKLVQMTRDIKPENLYTVALDDSPGGYLYSGISSADGAYILQPIGGSFFQLQNLLQNIFSDNRLKKENAKVMIQNGTTIPSVASLVSGNLRQAGITPVGMSNAKKQNYQRTEIYDYTNGKKPLTLAFLESWFGVIAQTNIPLELLSYTISRQQNLKDESGDYAELDFLVILGQDIRNIERRELIRTLTADELRATSTTGLPTSTPDLIPPLD